MRWQLYGNQVGGTPPPPLPDPIAWWKLDEGTGSTAADATGNGHTGTLVGSPLPAWVTGHGGGFALEFDGNDGHGQSVSVPSNAAFNMPVFTLSTWLKPIDNTRNDARLITRTNLGNNAGFDLKFNGTTGKISVGFTSGGSFIYANGASVISDGQWAFIAGRYDGTNLQVFINAVVDGPSQAAGAPDASTQTIGLGSALPFGSGTNVCFADLDDCRIYDVALTDAQITQLFGL